MESSQSLLQQCLDHTPGLIEAHLLMAQVHLHRGNYRGCTQVLEIGLSHNFEVGIIHPRVWYVFDIYGGGGGVLRFQETSFRTAKANKIMCPFRLAVGKKCNFEK